MADRIYRVGIIGVGRVASTIQDEVLNYPGRMFLPYSHTHAYATVPQIRVVAAADIDAAKLQAYRERWQPVFGAITTYASYEEMLSKERLDIVSVCTPASLHAAPVMAAAQAGVRAIFCEKAMATSLVEADAMLAACDEHRVKLVIDHTRRWDPYYESALKLVHEGRIGTVRSVVGHFGGALLHTGTHMLDLMLMFGQSPVEWVAGMLADGADEARDAGGSAHFRFANGAMGFIDGSSGPLFEVDVIGSAGRLRLSNFDAEFFTLDTATRTLVQRPFPVVGYVHSGMQGAVQEIIACIEQDTPSRSDGYAGRAALELALAVYASHKADGARVPLPLADRDLRVESR